MKQQLITMTQKELSRYEVIKNLVEKVINGSQAAKQTGLSVRQVRRLKWAVIQYGANGLIHKGREREGNKKIKPNILEKVKKYSTVFGGAGKTGRSPQRTNQWRSTKY